MNNNHATLQKLEQMKFHGMARAFTSTMETGVRNQFTADELVSHLVDAEWDDRHNRKLARLLKEARFRYRASFEEIDFTLNRDIDKNQLLRLSSCQWVRISPGLYPDRSNGGRKEFHRLRSGAPGMYVWIQVGYYPSSKTVCPFKIIQGGRELSQGTSKIKSWMLSSLMILVLNPLMRKTVSPCWKSSRIDMDEDLLCLYPSFQYPAGTKSSVIPLSRMLSVTGLFTMPIE